MPFLPPALLQPLRSRSANNVNANDDGDDVHRPSVERGSASGPTSRSYAGLVVPGIEVDDVGGAADNEEGRRTIGADLGKVGDVLGIFSRWGRLDADSGNL